jgi:hypothetical protein
VEQILLWVDAHRQRTGRWPVHLDGPLLDVPEESGGAINIALQQGGRGLPGSATRSEQQKADGERGAAHAHS